MFYLLRVFEPEDRDRFGLLAEMLPRPMAGLANSALSLLVRAQSTSIVPTDV
jgi:hypothetical protein